MKPFSNAAVAQAFDAYPPNFRRKLLALRDLILRTAATTDGVGNIEETLKWGEPAYVTSRSGSGSTIRIAWKASQPNQYAMYFNCRTTLVETFRALFPDELRFEGHRAIIFKASERIPKDAVAFCVAAALTYHRTGKTQRPAHAAAGDAASPPTSGDGPRLLAGGNPQVAMADGEAPVQAYIAAIPGWKREVAQRLDDLVTRTVPGVHKAVRWNSAMYGIKGNGWFASFHIFTNYVKLTFFKGTSLVPVPTGGEAREARWINIPDGGIDDARLVTWIKQAAAIPGWGKS